VICTRWEDGLRGLELGLGLETMYQQGHRQIDGDGAKGAAKVWWMCSSCELLMELNIFKK
jgi:hypothetical protein